MSSSIILLDLSAIERALARMANEIRERNGAQNNVALVGIPRGGVHLAQRLSDLLSSLWSRPVPIGCLDVSMHRDDLNHQPVPKIHPTSIPFDVNDKTVVLVDDVLSTGRSAAAGLALLDRVGVRPAAIGALMLQTERWRTALGVDAPPVVGVFATPLLHRTAEGWRP